MYDSSDPLRLHVLARLITDWAEHHAPRPQVAFIPVRLGQVRDHDFSRIAGRVDKIAIGEVNPNVTDTLTGRVEKDNPTKPKQQVLLFFSVDVCGSTSNMNRIKEAHFVLILFDNSSVLPVQFFKFLAVCSVIKFFNNFSTVNVLPKPGNPQT